MKTSHRDIRLIRKLIRRANGKPDKSLFSQLSLIERKINANRTQRENWVQKAKRSGLTSGELAGGSTLSRRPE
jgi:hypothetical protein